MDVRSGRPSVCASRARSERGTEPAADGADTAGRLSLAVPYCTRSGPGVHELGVSRHGRGAARRWAVAAAREAPPHRSTGMASGIASRWHCTQLVTKLTYAVETSSISPAAAAAELAGGVLELAGVPGILGRPAPPSTMA